MTFLKSALLAFLPVALIAICALTWMEGSSGGVASERLEIGSVAPKLNIAHWLQNGNGKYKKVSSFERGKVYVVEFWATTCGPCIESMPHLAELQTKYADKGLQIISISSEPLDEVKLFLKKKIPLRDGSKKTVEEVTQPYCLTTDPDGSSDADYMTASNQDGIPCAFIVGKDAKIEWIGHPMDMDDILESVLDGSWDREKYVADNKLVEEIQTTVGSMLKKKQFAEAVQAIDGYVSKIDDKRIRFGLYKSKIDIMMRANTDEDELQTVYASLFSTCDSEPLFVQDVAWSAYEAYMNNKFKNKKILELSIESVEKVLDRVDGATKANLLDTVARINHSIGRLDQAIAAQTKAVELSDGSDQGSFKQFLGELQSQSQAAKK